MTKMIKVEEDVHMVLKIQAYSYGVTLQEYMRILSTLGISVVDKAVKDIK